MAADNAARTLIEHNRGAAVSAFADPFWRRYHRHGNGWLTDLADARNRLSAARSGCCRRARGRLPPPGSRGRAPGAVTAGCPKLARMDSLPLLSTLAGAAIGIVATVIADRNRWKHDDAKEALRLRLDIYTQYTTTVKVLGETLRALAQREHPSDDERALALREAFRDSGISIASERMWLIAPQPVVKASNGVFHCLRRICDGYATGTAVSSPEDRARWGARGQAAARMRKLMREDLGVGPLAERHSPLLDDDYDEPPGQ
ncbi:hypothetical protein [Streptomyces sp. LaBMicrA B280]|uniref:hypothetical protein n=1 Tax=Streptomyces sp. LaBMicrA B280 TaxID=3391001 RepID=UPI003BA5E9B6